MRKLYCPDCGGELVHGRLKRDVFAGKVYEEATSICNGCGEPWETKADGFDESVSVERWKA